MGIVGRGRLVGRVAVVPNLATVILVAPAKLGDEDNFIAA